MIQKMALNFGVLSLFTCLLVSSTLILNFLVFPLAQAQAQAKNGGFSVDLIHRDSLKSPFRTQSSSSSISRFELLRQAFDRSLARAASYKQVLTKPSTIESQITSIGGEYIMKLSIGTPPVEINAIADTGSDVMWTQCEPCTQCYKQNDPLFDPEKSTSYRTVSCTSVPCQAVTNTCSDDNKCKYQVSYGDKSYTVGDLSTETFSFDSTSGRSVSIPKIVFGCGFENSGTFNETSSGIVGLGGGQLSIVRQLGKQIGGKFSYCLVPMGSESNSKLNFGSNADINNDKAVTTPLVKKSPATFYYLTLENVSVANKTLAFKKSSKKSLDDYDGSGFLTGSEGNIIIDSGTTLTFLPREFYHDLETTLRETIDATPTTDPQGVFGLCYNVGENEKEIQFPNIILHFTDADLELPSSNTFLEVSQGLVCLAITTSEDFAILGNISQMNFLIEYDLEEEKLSFLPTDCTKARGE